MNIPSFLSDLRRQDIKLWLEGERLRINAPKGALTAHLRAKLSEHKADLIAFLREAEVAIEDASVPPLRSVSRALDLPLSFAQERLWFFERFQPGTGTYNMPISLCLLGELQVEVLRCVFEEIVSRHEVLRTTFWEQGGNSRLSIADTSPWHLAVEDLRDVPQSKRVAVVHQRATEAGVVAFDLHQGPLLRTHLYRYEDAEYLLQVNLHHIVSDGWSLGILLREVIALYEAFVQNKVSPLPPLPIQYADFAHWQRQWLQGEMLEQQLGYWKKRLAGVPMLELPTDRPRPAVQSFRGAHFPFAVPKDLSESLKQLAKNREATLFMVLLGAFKALLFRYSGQQDLCIGTAVAGRTRPELEPLIGFFINTLALRTDLSGDPSFNDLLGRVKETTLGAHAHQEVPFERLVDVLGVERDLSHAPLFQVLLVLQNTPMQAASLSGLEIQLLTLESGAAKYDLTFELTEEEAELVGSVEYNTDLFDAATIARMCGHFLRVLQGVVAHPEERLSRLPLMATGEAQQILEEWNQTAQPYPENRCLHDLFSARARAMPDSIAAVFKDQVLRYGELEQRANRLAHYLQGLGVVPSTLVGLCIHRSFNLLVAVLGVFKAGGAYVPLDPSYPPERLAFMLEDAKVAVLLTQTDLLDTFPKHNAQVVDVVADWPLIAALPDLPPPCEVEPEHMAYVIYTSGSTGRPKGVMGHHLGMMNLLKAQQVAFGITEDDRVLQFASLSFDASIWEICMSLPAGARLVLAPKEVFASPEALTKTLHTQKVTVATLPPTLLRVLPPTFPTLRLVISAGEDCTQELVRQWAQNRDFVNAYGPTEVTVCGTLRYCNPKETHAPPIGRPIVNASVYILDAHNNPVPIGVPGEIYIGGHGVTLGYLHRPELTREKFVPDPFTAVPGARMYRTGDLGHFLANGEIAFMGRIDHQIKLRGYRIELGEIEAALGQCVGVHEAVVIVREDRPGDRRLVAYVAAKTGQQIEVSTLREALREGLTDYMIPAAFVLMETLPLTPNGKINRKALPVPETDTGRKYVPPRNLGEEALATIWAELLDLERVGIHENFFDLGGHSLLVTQVISRVRENFEVELPLRALFETPTVATLLVCIEQARLAGLGVMEPPLVPVQDPPVLSFAQQRLWFLDQLSGASATYNIPLALHIQGPLAVAVLTRVFAEIIQRHQVLQTSVTTVEGQAVLHRQPLQLEEVMVCQNLADLDPEAQANAVQQAVQKEAGLLFQLHQPPLIRTRLLQLAEEEHVLLLTMHHIISDGWSMGILVREVAALYPAYLQALASPLPALPLQYTDFAHWQRQWLQGEVLEQQLKYWRGKLSGVGWIELPWDRPRPPVQGFQGAQFAVQLDAELHAALMALARSQGATLFMVLLTAFKVLLLRYTGQSDLCVGTPVANRTRSELEGLIGFFVNTLALRTDLADCGHFIEALGRVRETTLGAYAHQEVPFERLVDELGVTRDLSHTPLFQVLFALQNVPVETLELPNVTLAPLPMETHTSKFDLSLALQECDQGLIGSLEYNTDLLDKSTVVRLWGHFECLVHAIVATPTVALENLPLLPASERQQLLVDWNDYPAAYPDQSSLSNEINGWVQRTPEALAVVCGERTLCYAELSNQARALAVQLQAAGVVPGTVVGLCMGRDPELMVALLGILEAGGAYLPLDPEYPPERLTYMLEDAEVSVLLTQSNLLDRFPAREVMQRICLDQPILPDPANPEPNPITLDPDRLAYIIYTSGSTGRPKGVRCGHRGVLNLLADFQVRAPLEPGMPASAWTSVSFDVSVYELFAPLCAGGALYLVPKTLRTDAQAFCKWLAQHQIQSAYLPPFMLPDFSDWLDSNPGVSKLRRLLVGVEPISEPLLASFMQRIPGLQVINGYGPTEATICCSLYSVLAEQAPKRRTPIGKPVHNSQLYVLDQAREPVPVGVVGELYVGGVGVAHGYHKQPTLTAESFITNPFLQGETIYRTGDRVRYLADGNLEFMGRADDQVKVGGYRIELGEIESVLVRHPAVRECVVLAREEEPEVKRLVAYIVAEEEETPTLAEFRAFLKADLADFMLPSAFVFLQALPLSPNGKLNRKALPAPERARPQAAHSYRAPRTEQERTLCTLWQALLGLEQVGITDNFFALGGDSILSIQLISRARRAGLTLTPQQLFEHQTIEALANVAGQSQQIEAEQGLVTGDVELTPIQHWFFEQPLYHRHHWNQALLLRLEPAFSNHIIEAALQALLQQHDVLRLRFRRTDSGWSQFHVPITTLPLRTIELGHVPTTEINTALQQQIEHAQASLWLASGPLWRPVLFQLSDTERRLLLVFHHLVIDSVSWRIVMEDLDRACQQKIAEQTIQLGPKTTSYQQWSKALATYGRAGRVAAEADYWHDVARTSWPPLPCNHAVGSNAVAEMRTVSLQLTLEETENLLQQANKAYRTGVEDLLLAALLRTISQWANCDRIGIDREGHGRLDHLAEVDLTRSLGWFTVLYPVVLQETGNEDLGLLIKSVKEQLRAVPGQGVGYGLLRYQAKDTLLAKMPAAPIAFNYLGQLDQQAQGQWQIAPESPGPAWSPQGQRSHEWVLGAAVRQGCLRIDWAYSGVRHQPEIMANLAVAYKQSLQALLAHCRSPEAGGYTPSDFPLAKLDQPSLDRLLGPARDLENLYPLTPLQEGMLFQTLYQDNPEIYFDQIGCEIRGPLDTNLLNQAWQAMVAAHPVLRTLFAWEGLARPLQLVWQREAQPLTIEDWQEIAPEQCLLHWQNRLKADRQQGFQLDQGPLIRLCCLRWGHNQHRLIWSHHHILLDGWSMPRLFGELLQRYEALASSQSVHLPPVAPYQNFIAWLEAQDAEEAERFWRAYLQGFHNSTTLGMRETESDPSVTDSVREQRHSLPVELTHRLTELARTEHLTLNTLVQAAWAILLGRYNGEEDILFGITVSGRPAELSGVESMIGLFINTIPLRVRLEAGQPLVEWLRELRQQQETVQPFESTALLQIQQWSEVPKGQGLFDSLLIFDNYPMESGVRGQASTLEIGEITIFEQTNFPLMLVAAPGDGLQLSLSYDPRIIRDKTAVCLMTQLQTLFEGMVEDPWQRVDTLPLINETALYRVLGITCQHYQNILPLTAMQRDLYLSSLANPDTTQNSLGYAMELHGKVDVALWQTVLQEYSDTQSVLRSHIIASNAPYTDIAYQCVARELQIVLDVIDLSESNWDQVLLETKLQQTIFRPYAMQTGPWVYYFLFKLAQEHYIAAFAAHHMFADGVTIFRHLEEVCRLYQVKSEGGVATIEVDCFADYVAYNRRHFDTYAIREFWADKLRNTAALNFPATTSTASPEAKSIYLHTLISQEHWQAVKAYTRRCRITPALYFKALYVLLIQHYCQPTEDFQIAEFGAGRPKGHASTIGCYYEKFPFVFAQHCWQKEETLDAVFTYLRTFQKELKENRHISNFLQRRLVPQEGLEFLYNYCSFVSTLRFLDSEEQFWQSNPYPKGTVELLVYQVGEQLRVDLRYPRDRFQDLGFLYRFQALSRQIVEEGIERLEDLRYLTEEETLTQCVHWNKTALPMASTSSVQALFEAQVKRSPEAVAVLRGTHTLSYQALNERANRLAHYLLDQGVTKGTRIGICAHRSFDMVVGVLGIIKAGCAYLPLDPAYPKERIHYIVTNAEVPWLVTQQHLLPRIPHYSGKRLCLDQDGSRLSTYPCNNPTHQTTEEDLLYVIYTSGSTGQPKGAGVVHRGELNLLAWYTREFNMEPKDRVLLISALGFDLTQKNLFAPLTVGACLVLPEQELYDDHYLLEQIYRQGVTWLNCAPSAFYPLTELPDSCNKLANLRLAIFGGEAIAVHRLPTWLQENGCQLVNSYGPTECTDIATFHRLGPLADYQYRSVPLGRPNDNVRLYILDEQNQLLPTGLVGELCIAGSGVGIGYINDAKRTAEQFINHSLEPGERLYRTGDRVRYLADGQLEYLGRKDFQVKLRGLRIELGEIEYALQRWPEVQDSVVIVHRDRLVAYLLGKEKAIDCQALRAGLEEFLPAHMVPSGYVTMAKWPLTPNGKIDRKALPEADQKTSYVAPRNPLEQALAEIWAQVLGQERVGIHEDFFQLGGHSLLLIQLLNRIQERLEQDIPMAMIFQHPTVAGLAAIVENTEGQSMETRFVDLDKEAILDKAICSTGKEHSNLDGKYQHLFLTGATGYLGAFLLYALLVSTKADLHCLVRAKDLEKGRERLRTNLAHYSLWQDQFEARIHPVLGDLTKPRLGIIPTRFDWLAHHADAIYHNGALVSYASSYAVSKAINVGGTHEVLRLAAHIRTTPVHIISTLSVFLTGGVIREDTPLKSQQHPFYFGYSASKWVAERLVEIARERDIPCNIYRPGHVTGHSQSGFGNTDDFFHRMMIGCVQLGYIPEEAMDSITDLTPVDYTANAIVHLSLQAQMQNKTYHLINPQFITQRALFEQLGHYGRPTKAIPTEKWVEQVEAYDQQHPDSPFHAIMPLIQGYKLAMKTTQVLQQESEHGEMEFDLRFTQDALRKGKVECKKPEALLEVYCGYFDRVGLW